MHEFDVANIDKWVWYKSRCTGFLNARRAPLKKSENILVFYQKAPAYYPQFDQGEPYKKIQAAARRTGGAFREMCWRSSA